MIHPLAGSDGQGGYLRSVEGRWLPLHGGRLQPRPGTWGALVVEDREDRARAREIVRTWDEPCGTRSTRTANCPVGKRSAKSRRGVAGVWAVDSIIYTTHS